MRVFRISLSGLSFLFALSLALWEVYLFWITGPDHGARLGVSFAWLILIYLSFQLLSIPFSNTGANVRFVGVLDSMASLVPLGVMLVVIFGKPHLLVSAERWEAAVILLVMNAVDLFGGFAFNLALSRRTVDFFGSAPSV